MTTLHSLERAKERMGMNAKVAKKQIKHALERGKTANNFSSWEKYYLEGCSLDGCKAIAYNGFCYIFNEYKACVTMYPLPNWFGKKKYIETKQHSKGRNISFNRLFEDYEDTMTFAFA